MLFKKIYNSRVYTVLEFLLFFVFIPFIANRYLEDWFKIIPLIFIAVLFTILLRIDPNFDNGVFFRLNRYRLKKSVTRVIIITILLIWFTWWVFPDLLL